MIKLNESIDEFIANSKLLTNNSLNDETIKQAVALFGYDENKLTGAQNLIASVTGLHELQIKEYGDQYQAQDEFQIKRKDAHTSYMDLLTIARIALSNNVGAQQSLGLNQARKKSYSGWLGQALQFFNNLISNPDYTSAMEIYGQTIEKIQMTKKGISDTQSFSEKHKIEKGEAQQATQARDAKIDELNQWVSDYKKIARIALKSKPQLLEKLGILERS
jgi:hypothetical protein